MTAKWWHRWFLTPGELSRLGVVGINARNGRYLLPNNNRKFYRTVDDKVMTKKLAIEMEIPVPELYGTIDSPGGLKQLAKLVEGKEAFVVKPARGSGGKGCW